MSQIEPFYGRLGRRIRMRREELGWSQSQLAAALIPAQTRSSIANIEAGSQRVLAHTLAQIADVLAVEVEELLSRRLRIKAIVETNCSCDAVHSHIMSPGMNEGIGRE